MSGKKPPLNSKIRELLAKIQRDFHFPKVYALRCAINTDVHPLHIEVPVNLQTIPPLKAPCQDYATDFALNLRPGHIEPPECRTSQPLEESATQIQAVECFNQDELEARTLDPTLALAKVKMVSSLQPDVLLHSPRITIGPGRVLGGRFPFSVRVSTNTRRIHLQGILFAMTLMGQMPMRMVIRYRAQALRKLDMKAKDIDFIGVCPLIPPAPLRFVELEAQDGLHYAKGVLRGIPDYQLSSRAWVIYRHKPTHELKAVTVRKEQ